MEINNVPPDHLGMLSNLRLKNAGCFEYAKELVLVEIEFHNGRIDSSERRNRIETIRDEQAPEEFINDAESLEMVTIACNHLLALDE